MSQGYAERRFPDPVQLSPENPGRLVPATMGFLPGALPGRGGGGARDVPAPVAANGKNIARETVPANAANLPSHLRNGLPFAGFAQATPEHTPLPVAAPAPVGAPSPVAAPPAFVAAPTAAEPAPPPRVLTPPPGLVEATLAPAPAATPEVPAVANAEAIAPPAPVAPPPMVGAAPMVPPGMVVAAAPIPPAAPVAATAAAAAPAPVALPPGMAVTPPMGVASADAGAAPIPGGVRGAEPEVGAPDASASPWLREAGAIPVAPAPVYRPEPPPEAKPQPRVEAPSGGGKGVFVVIGLVVVAALGGVLYVLRDDVKKAMGQGGSSGDTPVKLETPKEKAAATAKEPETTSSAPVLPSAKPAPTTTVQAPPPTPGTGRWPPSTAATAPKTADPQKPPPKFDPSGI